MFRKLSFSLAAALMLSVGAHAASVSQLERAEEGNPDSIRYADRMASAASPTNDDIGAAERGEPDSIDNKDQSPVSSGDWRAEWEALESEDPDVV